MTMQTQDTQALRPGDEDAPERTREGRAYTPRADVYETEEAIFVLAEMPGVAEDGVSITLEKNVLTVSGTTRAGVPEGYRTRYREYWDGDYERRFALANTVDRDGIEASMKHGVLTLKLPKAREAVPRRIEVRSA